MKENQIAIRRKNSQNEHATKIGFLHGPYTNFASPKWHEEFFVAELNVNEKVFEIKKERVHERNYFSTGEH